MGEDPTGNGIARWPLWAQLISVLGFPIFVALWLMGMYSGYIHSPLTEVQTMMADHVKGDMDRNRLLRVMCRHQANALRLNPDDCDTR